MGLDKKMALWNVLQDKTSFLLGNGSHSNAVGFVEIKAFVHAGREERVRRDSRAKNNEDTGMLLWEAAIHF